jgi:hypothetical protein
MHYPNLLLVVSFALFLAGCGAGGGDESAAAPATDTTGGTIVPAVTELGTRSVPGGQVTVTALTPPAAGQSATFRITTAGMTGITAVEVLLGTGFGDAQPLMVIAEGDAWLATTTLPDPLPASCRVLVRLTDASGTVQETGVEDFAIAGP